MANDLTYSDFLHACATLEHPEPACDPPCMVLLATGEEWDRFNLGGPCEGPVLAHHFECGSPPIWACTVHWGECDAMLRRRRG